MSNAGNPIVITSTNESSQPLAEREVDSMEEDEVEEAGRNEAEEGEEERDEDEDIQEDEEEEGVSVEGSHSREASTNEGSEGRVSSLDEDQEMADDQEDEADGRGSEQGSSRSRQPGYDTASDSESDDDRDPEELARIALEIRDLEAAVPLLRDSYHLVDRLGEGTFSSVYKAVDLHHTLYDNTRWAPPSPPDSLNGGPNHEDAHPHSPFDNTPPTPPTTTRSKDPFTADHGDTPRNNFTEKLQLQAIASGKLGSSVKSRPSRKGPVYVALKRIYVTSSPQRILNELELLAELREARNVAYLIQAIRHEDQVIAVMPYQRHQDFRLYYRTASLSLIRCYLRCIFSALADSHAKGIIHRDVKPANFLFDVKSRQGYLCDFGLAEKVDPAQWHGKCLHSLPNIAKGDLHGTVMPKPLSTFAQLKRQWSEWEKENPVHRDRLSKAEKSQPWYPRSPEEASQLMADAREHTAWQDTWRPAPHGGLLGGGIGSKANAPNAAAVSLASERVGVKKDDQRPSVRANRAGTRGFRAPEVLLKCPDQTVALDVWSVGMILLCFLTRRFPFFNSNDDTEALLELSAMLGRKRLEAGAIQHNRTIMTNIPHATTPSWANLHELVRTLNPTLYAECRPGPGRTSKQAIMREHKMGVSIGDDDTLDPFAEPWYEGSELWQAVQLMRSTLTVDCTKRITAAKALRHPFFTRYSSDP